MKAVILAAGEGSRMRPLTYARPKAMLPVANKPLLEHLLIAAGLAGISEFVFVVGYRDEQVREYFLEGGKWGVRIEYRLQRQPRGTADALCQAQDTAGETFLVMNGDVLTGLDDLARLASGAGLMMTGRKVDDLSGLGVVEVEDGKVIRIHEKTDCPPSNLVNAGCYRLTAAIFDAIASTPLSSRGECELTESLQILIDRGESISFLPLDAWLTFTYPWDLLDANNLFIPGEGSSSGIIEPGASVEGACSIGDGSRIRSGCYIRGPVIIGKNCDIGPNCFIRPATAIADDCHIGSAVEIKNSIIMRGTKIPHMSYVGDSIIGENCNLGAGTQVANLRLDKKDALKNKRRKLGVIMGNNVSTGINSSINVGALIGDNTVIGPGVLASGRFHPDSVLLNIR